MKIILAASIVHLVISSFSFANGGLSPERQEAREKKSIKAEEIYLDELKTREAAFQREERTKEKMRENPRNGAIVESFGQIDSKEDDQERQEEKKVDLKK